MVQQMISLLALGASMSLGQTTSTTQSSTPDQDHSKKHNDDVTVSGCVAKQNGDYILIQTDPGNTYQLERSRKLRLAPYLGQQVALSGTEYPSMATSSDYLARSGVASR